MNAATEVTRVDADSVPVAAAGGALVWAVGFAALRVGLVAAASVVTGLIVGMSTGSGIIAHRQGRLMPIIVAHGIVNLFMTAPALVFALLVMNGAL